MDKAHPLSFPMVVHSLDVTSDSFHPCDKGEEFLSLEVSYLSVIGVHMYLVNCTRSYIFFSYQFIIWESKQQLLGSVDPGYLSNPHKVISQTGDYSNS